MKFACVRAGVRGRACAGGRVRAGAARLAQGRWGVVTRCDRGSVRALSHGVTTAEPFLWNVDNLWTTRQAEYRLDAGCVAWYDPHMESALGRFGILDCHTV